jgi:pimeloyl-ACP methyl ester carboxylesterase
MATFVLIPGAGSDSWHWHRVVPLLEGRGHEAIAVDLPCDDEDAGLGEYADAVVEAIGERRDVVLVAQSMGGFTAPLVCERVPVDLVVLVAGMVPVPGESLGEWWSATGQEEAWANQPRWDGRDPDENDVVAMFLHDVPPDVVDESVHHLRGQAGKPFEEPWPGKGWPDVPTRFLLCRHDRLFPADFQRRIVKERLGITPDEMDSGHCPALAHPEDLAARLAAYWPPS